MPLDYGTLAQLMKPEMMPNAPIGAGGMAGQMYYQDKSRQDEALRQAASLAQLNAQQEAMKAEEFSRAQPGRLANIDTENALAQGKLGTVPDLLSRQGTEAKTGAMKASEDQKEVLRKQLEPYANDWANTSDPEVKKSILQQMKRDGITQLGNKNIDDVDPEKLDPIMQMIRSRQINTPAQVQKMDIEKSKEASAERRAEIAAKAKVDVQKMANAMKEQLQKAGLLAKLQDPNRVIFEELRKSVGDVQASVWYNDTRLAEAQARAGNQKQQIDIDIPAGSGARTRPPEKPKAVAPPLPNTPSIPTEKPPAGAFAKKVTASGRTIYMTKDGPVDAQGKPTEDK